MDEDDVAFADSEEGNFPYADDFAQWAESNSVDLNFRSDWEAWWNCFLAGVGACSANEE